MMSEEDEILDLPESRPEKKGWRDFKWLRMIALIFFILALFFRFNQWAGQNIFLIFGAFLFCIWAVLKFLFTKSKNAFDWLYMLGRVGLGCGLAFRFIYDLNFSPYLVYASMAILISAFWLHSRTIENS